MPRRAKWIVAALILAIMVLAPTSFRDRLFPTFTARVVDSHTYFRFQAKISHGDEMLDFDVVAACGIRVTHYRDKDRSVDFEVYPRWYALPTRDGHAVSVIVPAACKGQETVKDGGSLSETYALPKDLFPYILWHPEKEHLGFGILYVSEDAFENPLSQLRFHGATIHRATREQFEAWRAKGEAANLWTPYLMAGQHARPALSEVEAAGGWWPPNDFHESFCEGVQRFKLTDNVRAMLRQYWPAHRPRFWVPKPEIFKTLWQEIIKRPSQGGPLYDGHDFFTYDWGFDSNEGLPTRTGHGQFIHDNSRTGPVFPVSRTDVMPFYTPDMATSPNIIFNVDAQGGKTQGFMYCGINFRGLTFYNPDFAQRFFQNQVNRQPIFTVDGEKIETDPPDAWPGLPYVQPSFFERDEYFYTLKSP